MKKYWMIALAALGVVLMLIPTFLKDDKSEKGEKSEETSLEFYSERMEERLEALLESAQGVGKVRVILTLDSTREKVLAVNEEYSKDNYSAEYVIVNSQNEEEGIMIKEIYPKIRGVAVVCDGGDDPNVKMRVIELISAALGIPSNKIAVSP